MARKKSKKRAKKKARTVGPRTGGFITSSSIRKAGAEVKSSDLENISDLKRTGQTAILLNGLAQGTAINEHVGRKVAMKTLLLRYMVHPDVATYNTMSTGGSATKSHLCYRVLIVYDKQANGALASQANVLAPTTNSSNAELVAPNNLDNRDRFKVIYDKKGRLSIADPCHIREKFIKLKGREVTFQNTAATIADIATGSLLMYLLQDVDNAAGAQLKASWFSRLRYLDN